MDGAISQFGRIERDRVFQAKGHHYTTRALLGGWLGEHVGLRVSLGFAGVLSVALALLAWRHPVIQAVRSVPKPVSLDEVQATEESDQRPALGQ